MATDAEKQGRQGTRAQVSHSPIRKQRHNASTQMVLQEHPAWSSGRKGEECPDGTGGDRESFLEEGALSQVLKGMWAGSHRVEGSKGHQVKEPLKTEREIQRQAETLRNREKLTANCKHRERGRTRLTVS